MIIYRQKQSSCEKLFSLEYASQSEATLYKIKDVIKSFQKTSNDTGSSCVQGNFMVGLTNCVYIYFLCPCRKLMHWHKSQSIYKYCMCFLYIPDRSIPTFHLNLKLQLDNVSSTTTYWVSIMYTQKVHFVFNLAIASISHFWKLLQSLFYIPLKMWMPKDGLSHHNPGYIISF